MTSRLGTGNKLTLFYSVPKNAASSSLLASFISEKQLSRSLGCWRTSEGNLHGVNSPCLFLFVAMTTCPPCFLRSAPGTAASTPEPVFLNVYGAQESIPRNNSASLCSLAGRYDNPIPPRFLAPIDTLKIPAQGSSYLVWLLPENWFSLAPWLWPVGI